METKQFYVYITSNKNDTVLYIGVTNNLLRRIYEHKHHLNKGFTDRYNVTKLVYYEMTESAYGAISREKQLKRWSRLKKDSLIDNVNPTRVDLFYSLQE